MFMRQEDKEIGMRVSRKKAQEHRSAVLDAAARLFRERGASADLTAEHRDHPGQGCAAPALAADAARRDGAVRAAFTEGVRGLLDTIARHAPGQTEAERRAEAMRLLATLAGAVLLARAVDDATLADQVLRAAAAGVAADRQTSSP